MKILFLSSWFPYPPDNGSKIRINNLIRALAEYHELTLIAFADQPEINGNITPLQELCSDIKIVDWKPFNPESLRARLGFLSLRPRSLVATYSEDMRCCIERTLAAEKYDLVIASQLTMASYSPYFGDVPSIFEETELGIIFDTITHAPSLTSRARNGLTWVKQRRYMNSLLGGFRVCTVASENELSLLLKVAPSTTNVEVIPNSIELAHYQEYLDVKRVPDTLIFTGSFRYFANYDAMNWFLADIYPSVQKNNADLRLVITGDHADLALPALENVELTGYVEDIRPLIASSNLCVVPLRLGGGTRLKILEAMALKTAVISTSKGAEGLDVQHGKHIMIADTPELFAKAIIRLIEEPAFCQEIADNAYNLIEARYDWSVIRSKFLTLVDEVGSKENVAVAA